ncbi:metalloregulator ArsR/SmtB family transcription factor [Rhodococcus sp. AQ5-07]|uniref:metalloregulator ArsR/SmtB family transcription factor n=1 Tax=Rhodococcus sp. AQ5-07 TaxID=2054902 RepID=UPI001963836D|nr:metalloregulator ArsR/SmtB family transcription factor [Rhodococcus sp. AQ5-07]
MAEKLVRCVIDDLDGDVIDGAALCVEFSFRGIDYRIDMRKSNADKLNAILSPFIAAAAIVDGAPRGGRGTDSPLAPRSQAYSQPARRSFSGCDFELWRNRFEAMADPNRLRILHCLSAGPLCVMDLAVATDMTASAVSHAVRILRDWKIVSRTRDGRQMYYRLVDEPVRVLLRRQHVRVRESPT